MVLADCERALVDYEEGANTPFQWPRWVAVITLLRTVLDVLDEVDRPVGTRETRRRIHAARKRLFENKPEPRIFHEFIEDDRNDAVHLYEIRAQVNVTIQLGGVGTGGFSSPSGPAIYDFVMRDGPFKGRDPRELVREAIDFWRTYLDAIELEGAK